jgi:hypothetical protein
MVRELDMTPTAYLEIPRGWGRSLRITARTIAVHGHSRETVLAAGYSIINRIMAELHISNGIVWWRLRPEVEDRGDDKVEYRFLFRSRLATSPELPDTFWDEVAKPGGLPVTLSPETVWAQMRDPAFAKKMGIPQKVARDYVAADKRAGKYQAKKRGP